MDGQALLIFDLDGTLYRTASSFLPTMRSVFAASGIDAPPDDEIMGHVGEPFSAFLDWALERGLGPNRDALARRIADAEFASISERGELFSGVVETLQDLKERGYSLAICTNGDQDYAGLILRTFGIAGMFDAISTHEDERKSKTRMIAELRSRWPGRRAFVTGDRIHDIEAGHANGCTVIGAIYGYGSMDELSDADVCIERFDELISVVAAEGQN